MAAAILLLLVLMLIGGIGINLYLRSWVREQSRREAHLRDPNTHTVAYAIPTRCGSRDSRVGVGASRFHGRGRPRRHGRVRRHRVRPTRSVSRPAVPSKASG